MVKRQVLQTHKYLFIVISVLKEQIQGVREGLSGKSDTEFTVGALESLECFRARGNGTPRVTGAGSGCSWRRDWNGEGPSRKTGRPL